MVSDKEVKKAAARMRKEKLADITIIANRKKVCPRARFIKKGLNIDEKRSKCTVNLPFEWIKQLGWHKKDVYLVKMATDLNGITIGNMSAPTAPKNNNDALFRKLTGDEIKKIQQDNIEAQKLRMKQKEKKRSRKKDKKEENKKSKFYMPDS